MYPPLLIVIRNFSSKCLSFFDDDR